MIAISIDGTAGTGKSTLAKGLAKDLGYNYVNTGEMYRALTIYFLENNIKNEAEVVKSLKDINIEIAFNNFQQQTFLNGRLLTQSELRREEVGKMASYFSQIPEVRKKTVSLQRETASKYNVVMEGRDIGSIVLPNADVKFYITASPEIRAERRYKELLLNNKYTNYQQIYSDIIERDNIDKNREISPLIIPENSHYVDTSNMNIEEVKEHCLNIIKLQIHR